MYNITDRSFFTSVGYQVSAEKASCMHASKSFILTFLLLVHVQDLVKKMCGVIYMNG
jgi:hypothetical protein